MANYANLLATIAANIYTNNNNEVTAAMVKTAVDQIVASLGTGYQYMGVATPATTPSNTDVKQFYIAGTPGTYTNFLDSGSNPLAVNDGEVVVLKYDTAWSLSVIPMSTSSLHDETTDDLNLGDKYGNVLTSFSGGHIRTKKFDSRELSLRMLHDETTDDLNLGDKYGNVLASFSGGHIRTKNFDSVTGGRDWLYGKKINVIGDSYVANAADPVSYSWHYRMAAQHNMIYRNYGINGNPLTVERAGEQPVCVRYSDMDNDADYIVVIGGKNDYNVQVPIADFKDGLRTLCGGLVQKYPGKKICFFTPWRVPQATLDDIGNPATDGIELLEYVDSIVDICKEYSLPVFDTKGSGIATYDATFRSLYFQGANDVSHLNFDGHTLMISCGTEFINAL